MHTFFDPESHPEDVDVDEGLKRLAEQTLQERDQDGDGQLTEDEWKKHAHRSD